MVIDLELSGPAPVRLPADYTQTGWSHNTTERLGSDHQLFTTMSDMHQIGRMLLALVPQSFSQSAHALVRKLLRKELSAEQALQDPWMLT